MPQFEDLLHTLSELAELLSRPCHVNAPLPLLRVLLESEDRPVFHVHTAGFSWRSQGLWYLDQMRRWGQLEAPVDGFRLVDQVFRADRYESAYAISPDAHVEVLPGIDHMSLTGAPSALAAISAAARNLLQSNRR